VGLSDPRLAARSAAARSAAARSAALMREGGGAQEVVSPA
jgi:hypothetical protein